MSKVIRFVLIAVFLVPALAATVIADGLVAFVRWYYELLG